MIMLPSLASNFYRKFGRQYTQWKYYNSICIGAYRILQRESILSLQNNKKIYRRIYTSAYFNDKSEIKDAKDITDKLTAGGKDSHRTLKEKSLGDIIVKTETDADKVVTKVTIEKAKSQETEEAAKQAAVAPPSMIRI